MESIGATHFNGLNSDPRELYTNKQHTLVTHEKAYKIVHIYSIRSLRNIVTHVISYIFFNEVAVYTILVTIGFSK